MGPRLSSDAALFFCSGARVAPRYWANDKPRHEVDFLVQAGDAVIPVEVKSGDVVKSVSLRTRGRWTRGRG